MAREERAVLSARVKKATVARLDEIAEARGGGRAGAIDFLVEQFTREGLSRDELVDAMDDSIDAVADLLKSSREETVEAVRAVVSKEIAAASKSLDRSARDVNIAKKNVGLAAHASMSTFEMLTWFISPILKATTVYLEEHGIHATTARGCTETFRDQETGAVLAKEKLEPSEFYRWWWGIGGYAQRLNGNPKMQRSLISMSQEFLSGVDERGICDILSLGENMEDNARYMIDSRRTVKDALERESAAEKPGKKEAS